ncbi:MAG: histidine triad nucleotide-binding protein [Anaerolineae bacterium]
MASCIFCQIAAHRLPAEILYQDEQITAFRDIHPKAPIHILIIPNRHIPSVNDIQPEDEPLIGRMFTLVRQLAAQEGIKESGYRLVVNTGSHGGQTIFHLHLHLLGKRRFTWPPG